MQGLYSWLGWNKVDVDTPLNPDNAQTYQTGSNTVVHNTATTNISTTEALEQLDSRGLENSESQEALDNIVVALDEAIKLTEDVRENFGLEEQKVADDINSFVDGKPDTEFEQILIEEGFDLNCCTCDSAGRLARIQLVASFIEKIKFVTNNEAQSTLGRYACNVTNVTLRLIASVLIPTMVRQAIAYAIESELQKLEPETQAVARMTIALLASSYPIFLNIASALRDRYNQTDTTSSNICRAVHIVFGMGAICAAYATGVLPSLAATLVAYNIYCVHRDATQVVIDLPDPLELDPGQGINDYDPRITAASGGIYAVNQMAVGTLMTTFASPSGQGAVTFPYKEIVSHDFYRSNFNLGGEVTDWITFVGLHCLNVGKVLRFKLVPRIPTTAQIMNALTGIHAARAALFTQVVLLGTAFAAVTSMLETQEQRNAADNAFSALFLGVFYNVLVGTITKECTLF